MILHEERLSGIDITVVACIESLAEKVKKKTGRDIIIVSAFRSSDEQADKYAQGRTKAGKIVTNAPPFHSPHEYYCAVDCWVMSEDGKTIDWNNSEYKNIAKEHAVLVSDKIVWGGNFKSITDFPHWEKKTWRNVRSGVEKIVPNTIS